MADSSELIRCNENNKNSTSIYLQDDLSRSHRALLPAQLLRDPAMTIGFHPTVRQGLVLLHVQRLCIQYIETAEPSTLEENDLIDLVDASISSCLQNAIDCCPNLKSLTICDIPNPATVEYYAWLRTRHVFTAETDHYYIGD